MHEESGKGAEPSALKENLVVVAKTGGCLIFLAALGALVLFIALPT